MTPSLFDLWLPIILASVAIFFASFIAWMVLPHHKKDYKALPDEDAFLEFMRKNGAGPGQYCFPFCMPEDANSDEMKARFEKGPNGFLSIWPSRPNFAKCLISSFLFYVLVSVIVAYLCGLHIERGADFMDVFQTAGTAGIMGYALALVPNAIWFNKPVNIIVKDVLDGVAYGLITGAIFAFMWPGPIVAA